MLAMLSLQEPCCAITFCQHNVPLGVLFHFYKLGRERILKRLCQENNLILQLNFDFV